VAALTVLKFNTPGGADSMLATLQGLQKQQLINVQDAAIVSWEVGKKKPKTQQLTSLAGAGALGGAFWGMLFGLLFFIPFLGLAIGAAVGALSGHFADIGIDDKFMKELSAQMPPNSSAVFVLVKAAKVEEVLPEVAKYGGTVLQTNLAPDAEQKLKDALAKAAEGGPAAP